MTKEQKLNRASELLTSADTKIIDLFNHLAPWAQYDGGNRLADKDPFVAELHRAFLDKEVERIHHPNIDSEAIEDGSNVGLKELWGV